MPRLLKISMFITLSVFLIISMLGSMIIFIRAGQGSDADGKIEAKQASILKRENSLMKRRLSELSPKGINLVVDTARNVLYLRNGNKVIKETVVSCGSGNILQEPSGKRVWIFDTPRGEFKIKSKLTDPVWIKPDWAFIEEGLAVPDRDADRVERGVLGDYALGFGNGYFIHGTLYTRLLGRNVSHGCIRVGDGDLKNIFRATPLNASIIIF